MTWSPLLHGADAERAMDAVNDIAAALTPEAVAPTGFSLSGGAPGIALFHLALGEALGSAEQTERGTALLDASVDAVSEQERFDPRLYSGMVGLSWALGRVGRRLGAEDPDESDIDLVLPRLLASGPWPLNYDLIGGLVGIGAHCLDRLPRPSARAGLDGVVSQLAALAERGEGGTAWFTTPEMWPVRAEQYPEGHYDVGFAHGNAGVVAFLAAASRAGVDGADDLLRDAVRWLRARYEPDGASAFPSSIAPDGTLLPARMAWCYGDPGMALALLAAGRALGDDDTVELARATALRCVGRIETSHINDTGLCHGSAGAAHVFNRLGQALDEQRLLDLARFWFNGALEGSPTETGYSFLEGAAGTGLALLSAATDVEPWWDFPLLLDSAGA